MGRSDGGRHWSEGEEKLERDEFGGGGQVKQQRNLKRRMNKEPVAVGRVEQRQKLK